MRAILSFIPAAIIVVLATIGQGCANIVPPTGGPRDSIPPLLVSVTPDDSSKNVRPSRITFTFDEFIDQIQNPAENVIISPTIASFPGIESRLRNVTVRLRDTLEPNTTYTINFGNAIRDVNEGNVLRDFSYVFSTGNTIDENTLSGKVTLAQTGKTDSTLVVALYRNTADSAVIKQRPLYYTRVSSSGNFSFRNLPEGSFAIYALPVETKRFDSTRLFAFLDRPVIVSDSTAPVNLFAYVQAAPRANLSPGSGRATTQDKRLRYTNPEGGVKDILSPLVLDFNNRRLVSFDNTKFTLTDTSYRQVFPAAISLDSSRAKIIVHYNWLLNTAYKLIIQKDAVADADGITLSKNDTVSFITKRGEDYGQVKIRFNNLDLSKNPVLQIVSGENVIESIPLNQREWTRELFKPGEYELRILFDADKNGVWTPGNFARKLQPEIVVPIPQPFAVKANWENEITINL
jgi:hypothetical protein